MLEGIRFSPQDTVPLEAVARGVAGFRTVLVNVYGIAGRKRSWTLVDAGLYFSANRIRRWAARHFGDVKPSAILLTHGHFDHVGSLRELAEGWDVPVYAHPLEMPYLTGKSEYPPPDAAVGGGAMAWMASFYPRGPIDLGSRVQPLPANGTLPELPGWQWIHTPGHTAGHVSFFRRDGGVLIAGDAIVTTKQESLLAIVSQRPELHGPPAYYTPDWREARLSVIRLASLAPQVAACGHGLPAAGPALRQALERLAETFERTAQPRTGRYIRQPAIMDERGVVALPPAAGPTPPKVLAAGALAGAAAFALWRATRSERKRQAA